MRNAEYSFWLLPAQPLYERLQALIRSFATAYHAIEFEPHVTLCSGPSNDEEAGNLLNTLCKSFSTVDLAFLKVGTGGSYTHSLFFEILESPVIRAMHRMVEAQSSIPQKSVLRPHLSLLYKDPTEVDLAEIGKSLELPSGKFSFDRVKVIETEIPVLGPETVSRWRMIKDCDLASTGSNETLHCRSVIR